MKYWVMDDPKEPKPSEILGVLLEFRDAVADQFARVDKRFVAQDAKIDRLERRIERLDDRFTEEFRIVNSRLFSIDVNLASIDRRVSTLESRRRRRESE